MGNEYLVRGRLNRTAKICVDFQDADILVTVNYCPDVEKFSVYNSRDIFFYHPLQRGLNLKRGGKNSFRDIYKEVYSYLFKVIWEDEPSVDISSELKGLHAYLVSVQDQFLSRLDPKLIGKARKFPNYRWNYYRFLKTYDHPHVDQMLVTCPGIISLLTAGEARHLLEPSQIKEIADSIILGEKTQTILEKILNALLNLPEYQKIRFDMWHRLQFSAYKRMKTVKQDWMWLVREASVKVSGNFLLMPPPVFIPKNQKPKGTRELGNWYKRIHATGMMMIPEEFPGVSMNQTKGLILMASQADLKFYRHMLRNKGGLRDFFAITGRVPNGKTNYKTFFADVAVFKQLVRPIAEIEDVQAAFDKVATNRFVHELNWSYQTDGFSIKPLTTIHDYLAESESMSNCMRKLWPEAYAYQKIHYHVQFGKNHYSLSVNLPDFSIEEMRGRKNTEAPTEFVNRVVDVFVEEKAKLIELMRTIKIPEKKVCDEGH